MQFLDRTLPTAPENLALDEALLEEAETAAVPTETLRLWEPSQPFVVLGRSSSVRGEVHEEACRALDIPILRRVSGGAAIVTGSGCLMYALILSYELRPQLRAVSQAHRWVLGMLTAALAPLVPGIQCQGTSDLAVGTRKFSGNSVRCRRHHLLYHGTLLYDFPLPLIEQCLAMPSRMPDYRAGRPHDAFVMNLPLEAAVLRAALRHVFEAKHPRLHWPAAETARLASEKYGRPEWNQSRS